jgi:hypothetical protein
MLSSPRLDLLYQYQVFGWKPRPQPIPLSLWIPDPQAVCLTSSNPERPLCYRGPALVWHDRRDNRCIPLYFPKGSTDRARHRLHLGLGRNILDTCWEFICKVHRRMYGGCHCKADNWCGCSSREIKIVWILLCPTRNEARWILEKEGAKSQHSGECGKVKQEQHAGMKATSLEHLKWGTQERGM